MIDVTRHIGRGAAERLASRVLRSALSVLRSGAPVLAVLCAVSVPAAARRLPDRDAAVILPEGMPVTVEHALFFDDGGLFSVRLRNGGFDAARVRVRIVVFDDRLRLRGSASYCAGQMQPGTRQAFLFPLEVKGATTRDQFAVLIDEVVTARRAFTLREPLAAVLRQARNAVDLRGSLLTTIETPRAGEISECPCACEPAEALAREGCADARPSAFTCTPMSPGCSQAFTCKP